MKKKLEMLLLGSLLVLVVSFRWAKSLIKRCLPGGDIHKNTVATYWEAMIALELVDTRPPVYRMPDLRMIRHQEFRDAVNKLPPEPMPLLVKKRVGMMFASCAGFLAVCGIGYFYPWVMQATAVLICLGSGVFLYVNDDGKKIRQPKYVSQFFELTGLSFVIGGFSLLLKFSDAPVMGWWMVETVMLLFASWLFVRNHFPEAILRTEENLSGGIIGLARYTTGILQAVSHKVAEPARKSDGCIPSTTPGYGSIKVNI